MVRGSAATHGSTVYCVSFDFYMIYSYQADQDRWDRHSKCPHRNTALTIINGCLTTIRGRTKTEQTTNKVLSLKGGRWEEEVPPMVKARWRHAAVSDGHTVVAAGGWGESSVEVFTGSSWSVVAGLPGDLPDITATLCGDLVYVMDWNGRTYRSPSLPSCPPMSRMQPHPPPAERGIPSAQLRAQLPPSPPSALKWFW